MWVMVPLQWRIRMNLNDPLYQSIFFTKLEAWFPNGMEVQDIKNHVHLLAAQGSRPAKRSDGLGAAFSALSMIEGIYERLCTATLTDYLAQTSSPVGADAGEDSNSGGGTGV